MERTTTSTQVQVHISNCITILIVVWGLDLRPTNPTYISSMVIGHGSMSMSMWSKVYVVGMGMGLVSEATAVEVGIQTREEGEARVR